MTKAMIAPRIDIIHPDACNAPRPLPKIKKEINPPTNDPTTPSSIVIQILMDCLPGRRKRAINPTIKPKMANPIRLNMFNSLLFPTVSGIVSMDL
jgi:hypothetical protein